MKVLAADEEKAFKEWDECALDRVYFLREYNPAFPPSYLNRNGLIANTAGESRSPTLLFAAEFKTYLNEREAFVARKSDYIGLLDAIIDQNKKLAHPTEGMSFQDVLTTPNQIRVDAGAAKTQLDALRGDLRI